jgi:hypothetical protein
MIPKDASPEASGLERDLRARRQAFGGCPKRERNWRVKCA